MLKAWAVVGATAISLAAAPAIATPSEAPPGKVTLDLRTVNGSGCKKDTTAVAVASDNTAFTVSYSEFIAEAGPGSPGTANRKNCQLAVNVHVPQGFTYAVAKADFRGYADLQAGATGLHRTSYYQQGSSQTERADQDFEGPVKRNFTVTNKTEIEELVWSRCGEDTIFNVNTELRINAKDSTGTSFMAMDSTDGSARTLFQVSWKRC
jgi:hypothetical protein